MNTWLNRGASGGLAGASKDGRNQSTANSKNRLTHRISDTPLPAASSGSHPECPRLCRGMVPRRCRPCRRRIVSLALADGWCYCDLTAPDATAPPRGDCDATAAYFVPPVHMNPSTVNYSLQPYQGTDVVAFVLGLAAVLYVALWRRDGERGMGWFALSMALLALWIAANRYHLPVDRYLVASPWIHVLTLGFASLALGLVGYLGLPAGPRRLALWAMLLPLAALSGLTIVADLGELRILRVWANLLYAVAVAAMGSLSWWAAAREPRAGHAYVGTALWSIPLLAVVMAIAQVDSAALRYWSVFPFIVLALTLLTVSLLRRRQALEAEVARRRIAESELAALNASLEATVAQRTVDLQDMVAALESFNRNVSHDLRGSLGGIAGAARLADDALRRGDDTLAHRVLPLIASQAEDSVRLVAALLSLAKVSDATLHYQVVNLRKLVQETVDQLRLEQGSQAMPQIEIMDLPDVNADPDLLRRVFANLIGNAIKFTRGVESGRIDIGATTEGAAVSLYVRDNGVGFDAAAATRLFSPFVRLHAQKFDGHGVGLSIVRRAVERHGGRVWAESRPGQGAVFHFSLPA